MRVRSLLSFVCRRPTCAALHPFEPLLRGQDDGNNSRSLQVVGRRETAHKIEVGLIRCELLGSQFVACVVKQSEQQQKIATLSIYWTFLRECKTLLTKSNVCIHEVMLKPSGYTLSTYMRKN